MSDEQTIMPIADSRREVAEQPAVVARVLRELRSQIQELAATLLERDIRQFFLLGSGDSWFAGLMARLAFERYGGVPVEPLQAYEYAAYGHPGFEARTAAIIISSSGRPTTTWDALERALATRAYVVGISDQRYTGNPFIEKAHTALVPGAMKKGMPAQTTTATLAVLIDLAIEFGRASGHLSSSQADDNSAKLRSSVEHMQTVLVDSDNLAGPLAQALQGRRFFTFIGGGPSYGVAHVGSALMAEGPQEVGLPLAVEEFHHALRFGTIAPTEPVVLIAPTGQVSSRNLDTARSVSNWGAQLIAIVDENDETITPLAETVFSLPPVPEPMSPLLTLLPLHNLSIHLAAQKIAAGYHRPSTVP
jgi:glucosamine 6-phosphate synthetase-like amidotransferase/phosphosugar isomerase protein